MGSVFYSKEGLEIHEQYDLKGSTKGRKAGPHEKMKKDLDLLENGIYLNVGRDKAKLFKQQLLLDTEFLRKNQIMDYSLLVGIHYRDRDPRHMISEQKTQLQDERKEPLCDSDSGGSPTKPCRVNRAVSTPIEGVRTSNKSDGSPRPRSSLGVESAMRKPAITRRSSMDPRHKSHYKLSAPLADQFIVPEIIHQAELDHITENEVVFKTPLYQSPNAEDSDKETLENPFTDTHGGMCFRNPQTGALGNEVYFTGVIDLLQQFNRRKKVESFLKTRMNNPQVISAVDPELYSRRFNRFIEEKIM